ncbi:hypothetical protein POV26_03780 [Aequorivita todarodis]|uniref:hypothetical protein n=1 Tax=Aequorivita todarodis TaxID=2036821 RepID=UPI00235011AF|nr:hypothetical protein [Aequorivita todarodis]MDC8000139.1 hypothetical protein [Aequorivita todarodis]
MKKSAIILVTLVICLSASSQAEQDTSDISKTMGARPHKCFGQFQKTGRPMENHQPFDRPRVTEKINVQFKTKNL